MDRVLIVSKTRMNSGVCVSGLTRATSRSIRLIPPGRRNQPIDTAYEIGQVWEMDFYDVSPTTPPHVEDVIVTNARFVTTVPNISELLMQRVQPWQGGPPQLFDGLLHFSNSAKGYVAKWKGIPNMSTGYWIPDKPLTKVQSENRVNYYYDHRTQDGFSIPYVGLSEAIDSIPAGTLVRVSLARWWEPEGMNEERCYLQLSGWYL